MTTTTSEVCVSAYREMYSQPEDYMNNRAHDIKFFYSFYSRKTGHKLTACCHGRGVAKKRLMKIELKLSLAGGATLSSICFIATWAVPPADPPTAPPMIP